MFVTPTLIVIMTTSASYVGILIPESFRFGHRSLDPEAVIINIDSHSIAAARERSMSDQQSL